MDEWRQLVIIAVVLLLLVGAMTVALRIFNTAQAVVDEQEQALVQTMAVMEESKFLPYDDKDVPGTVAKSAVVSYRSAPLAILVATLGQNSGTFGEGMTCINYNAVLGTNAVPADVMTQGTLTTIDTTAGDNYKQTGRVKADSTTGRLDLSAVQNNSFRQLAEKSDMLYINPRGVFKSELIVDENNQIIGIQLRQKR